MTPLVLWLSALTLAALATWTLYDAAPGLSWGLWTMAASAAGVLCGRGTGPGPRIVLVVIASLLTAGAAVTANPVFHFWTALGTIGLLATAVRLTGDPRPERITLGSLLTAAPVTAVRAMVETGRRVGDLADRMSGTRWRPAMRGGAAAVVVVGTLGGILAGADPILAAFRDGLVEALERLDFMPRLIFFGGALVVALGSLGIVLRAEPLAPPAARAVAASWGDVERLMVVGAVVALFTTFLGLQVAYLFGNPAAVAGSGITFAEWARRGFAEITVVATLCTLLLLGLERHAARGQRERLVRALELVLVAELELLLVSASRRVGLYEGAYGFTTARLYAQTYMVVMALGIGLLAADLARRLDAGRLLRRVGLLGALAIIALSFWNHEAWIARANLARHAETGKLDATYLVWGLSPNALPALAGGDRPPSVREGLRERYGNHSRLIPCRWFEWNLRHRQAVDALVAAGIPIGGAVPSGCVRIARGRSDH